MGLIDAIGAEDRVEVKYSDFYDLVRAEAEKTLLENAVIADIPREYILKMLTGENDELEEYRKTELTPDQIREIDRLYAEKCAEVAKLKSEYDDAKKQLDQIREDACKPVTMTITPDRIIIKSATQEDGGENDS